MYESNKTIPYLSTMAIFGHYYFIQGIMINVKVAVLFHLLVEGKLSYISNSKTSVLFFVFVWFNKTI